MYQFDYRKLKGKITEVFGSQVEFARALNISKTTMSKKLSGKHSFTQSDIYRAAMILEINPTEISEYFFKIKIQ